MVSIFSPFYFNPQPVSFMQRLNAGISSKYTVAIGLYKMLDKSLINSYFTQFCAGGVLVSIPISILFMIMQKFYVEGITGGAVKG